MLQEMRQLSWDVVGFRRAGLLGQMHGQVWTPTYCKFSWLLHFFFSAIPLHNSPIHDTKPMSVVTLEYNQPG